MLVVYIISFGVLTCSKITIFVCVAEVLHASVYTHIALIYIQTCFSSLTILWKFVFSECRLTQTQPARFKGQSEINQSLKKSEALRLELDPKRKLLVPVQCKIRVNSDFYAELK